MNKEKILIIVIGLLAIAFVWKLDITKEIVVEKVVQSECSGLVSTTSTPNGLEIADAVFNTLYCADIQPRDTKNIYWTCEPNHTKVKLTKVFPESPPVNTIFKYTGGRLYEGVCSQDYCNPNIWYIGEDDDWEGCCKYSYTIKEINEHFEFFEAITKQEELIK